MKLMCFWFVASFYWFIWNKTIFAQCSGWQE